MVRLKRQILPIIVVLTQVVRIERGITYYIDSDTMAEAQWQLLYGFIYDRMMETILPIINSYRAIC